MSEDDKAIHGLLLEWGTTGDVDTFRQSVVNYIATARKEARAAAWTQALNMARVTAASTGMPELWALYEAMKREFEKG